MFNKIVNFTTVSRETNMILFYFKTWSPKYLPQINNTLKTIGHAVRVNVRGDHNYACVQLAFSEFETKRGSYTITFTTFYIGFK